VGRAHDAIPLLERSLKACRRLDAQRYQPLRLASLGEAHLLTGQPDRAASFAARALEAAEHLGERGHVAWSLRVLADIAAHVDAPDVKSAHGHYQRAMALASELGMRPLVAHCHLGLAKLCSRTGKRREAREHLAAATTMYREMNMPFWLEQAGTELKAI
jgi:tetratricopeptide (TPR) repeat protein